MTESIMRNLLYFRYYAKRLGTMPSHSIFHHPGELFYYFPNGETGIQGYTAELVAMGFKPRCDSKVPPSSLSIHYFQVQQLSNYVPLSAPSDFRLLLII